MSDFLLESRIAGSQLQIERQKTIRESLGWARLWWDFYLRPTFCRNSRRARGLNSLGCRGN